MANLLLDPLSKASHIVQGVLYRLAHLLDRMKLVLEAALGGPLLQTRNESKWWCCFQEAFSLGVTVNPWEGRGEITAWAPKVAGTGPD